MSLRHYLRILGPGHKGTHNLSVEDADRAFSAILSGQESEIQVGAFLVLVRTKGLTVEELTGFTRAARRMATIPCQGMDNVVALCPPPEGKGTGDDPQLVEACGRATLAVLSGVPSSARDATLLSAALALKAAGRAHTIAEGVDLAARSLDSGAASAVLERLRALS